MSAKNTDQPAKTEDASGDENDSDRGRKVRPKTALDTQKAQVEKLMKRIDKEIILPTRPSDTPRGPRKEGAHVVRNIQGSSAGAGSGEFHVYRALRRKEYTRLKALDDAAQKEEDRIEYESRQQTLKAKEMEKTNKNREKRLKRKRNNEKTKPIMVGPALSSVEPERQADQQTI